MPAPACLYGRIDILNVGLRPARCWPPFGHPPSPAAAASPAANSCYPALYLPCCSWRWPRRPTVKLFLHR